MNSRPLVSVFARFHTASKSKPQVHKTIIHRCERQGAKKSRCRCVRCETPVNTFFCLAIEPPMSSHSSRKLTKYVRPSCLRTQTPRKDASAASFLSEKSLPCDTRHIPIGCNRFRIIDTVLRYLRKNCGVHRHQLDPRCHRCYSKCTPHFPEKNGLGQKDIAQFHGVDTFQSSCVIS